MKFSSNPLDKIFITQKFGEWPEHYAQYRMKGHNGIDLRTRYWDTPRGRRHVYAVWDGSVMEIRAENAPGYGRFVRLRHADGGQTIYAHLRSVKVVPGEAVKSGQIIAISDNSGDSTGPHLHFGYRPAGFNYANGYKGYIDPEEFFV